MNNSNYHRKIISLSPLIIAIPFVILAVHNINIQYSYWVDEIWSVVASSGTWQELFAKLLSDVHPPLYQIILKLWMSIFGKEEPATRVLSLLFSITSLVLLAVFGRRRSTLFQIASISFFVSCPAFAFYAQETRSYALILLVSCAFTIATLNLDVRPQNIKTKYFKYALAIILSLTHYFGLIYSFIVISLEFVTKNPKKQKIEHAVILLTLLIWPIFHYLFGDISKNTSGNFWIKVSGPYETVEIFLSGVFPLFVNLFLNRLKIHPILILPAFILLCYLTYLIVGSFRRLPDKDKTAIAESEKLLSVVLLFVIGMAAVDLLTPMSTPRYYIVLLPAASLLFGDCIDVLAKTSRIKLMRALAIFAIIFILIGNSKLSYADMTMRWTPRENLKALGESVIKSGVCEQGCSVITSYPGTLSDFSKKMLDIYFPGIKFNSYLERKVQSSQPIIGTNAIIDEVKMLAKKNPNMYCFAPSQSWEMSTFIFVKSSSNLEGLQRCKLNRSPV
jgi:mannosyltransferase